MYIIIKLLSYYYYFIIIFFPHERRGLHDPILVLINSISSSSSYHGLVSMVALHHMPLKFFLPPISHLHVLYINNILHNFTLVIAHLKPCDIYTEFISSMLTHM